MPEDSPSLPPEDSHAATDHVFRHEAARLRASLVRAFGARHIDLAEDVVQDALVEALKHWRFHGVPDNPGAWLLSVARRRAIDELRRDRVLERSAPGIAAWLGRPQAPRDAGLVLDDQLAMLFACAAPQLAPESRIALMLHLVAGFSIAEVARAFLLSEDAASQRILRAKRLLRDEQATIEVPDETHLPERLDAVLDTIYLMLNEGHAPGVGNDPVRLDVLEECTRLCELLLEHPRTTAPAVHAMLAMTLFTRSRTDARMDEAGVLLMLDQQPRDKWNQALIQRGFRHLALAASGTRLTRYHIEAAIASIHARATTFESTDWAELLSLYDLLVRAHPTPIVRLNRVVVIAMLHGPQAGLHALDEADLQSALANYPPFHAVRAQLFERADLLHEARAALLAALALPWPAPHQRLLTDRLANLEQRISNGNPDRP